MEALRQALQEVTDEDLVALSNKGTVKRAYKDLEGEEPCAAWREEETEVTLKEAVCTIRLPFAESTCNCPSRSMCRHRITAILWLRLESAGEQSLSKKEIAAKREAVPDKKQEQEVREKPRAEKKVNEMQAAELAAAWKEAFVLQFSTGLTRLSQETEESMERLALLSHRAGFAELERGARRQGASISSIFPGRYPSERRD